MVDALKSQIRWLVFGSKLNPWERWHPFRWLVHWYNTRQMDNYLNVQLDKHLSKARDLTTTKTKSIVSLALQTYLAEDKTRTSVDETFRLFTLSQIKQFLFSGHDTTSSTLCYVFYLLSTNPTVLQRVRDEQSHVFGADQAGIIRSLEEKPHLLNQLPYTTAVLKETLRLYPVGSSLRGGEPGYFIRDVQGRSFPTDGYLVWAVSQPLHRDPDYWPQPDAFLPDRWLVGPGDPLYPVKGTWRPFEFGPRNCIGQELATVEIKTALLLVLHKFAVDVAYNEFDDKFPRRHNSVEGERAYQLTLAGPSDGLPCKIKRRVGAGS